MKTLKALAVFVLFLSAVYLGLLYFYNEEPQNTDLIQKNKKLEWLKEKLEEIDCDIQEQIKDGLNIENVEEARRELLREINTIKKDISYNFDVEPLDLKDDLDEFAELGVDKKQDGLLSVDIPSGQKTLPEPLKNILLFMGTKGTFVFVGLLLFVFVLLLKNKFTTKKKIKKKKIKKKNNLYSESLKLQEKLSKDIPIPENSPNQATNSVSDKQLQNTIDKFKSIMPQIQEKETTELNIADLELNLEKSNSMQSLDQGIVKEEEIKDTNINSDIKEEVLLAVEDGYSVEQIAERFRLDQTQVNLIIKFNN